MTTHSQLLWVLCTLRIIRSFPMSSSSYTSRIASLFSTASNPVAGLFQACPAISRRRHGTYIEPMPSDSDGQKIDALYKSYLQTGNSKTLNECYKAVYRAVPVQSVDYLQASEMCNIGMALAKVSTTATDLAYQLVVKTTSGGKDKGKGAQERVRRFFDSVCVDADNRDAAVTANGDVVKIDRVGGTDAVTGTETTDHTNNTVKNVIAVDPSDTIGAVAIAAAHMGFRVVCTATEKLEQLVHNLEVLAPLPYTPRDARSKSGVYGWAMLPPAPVPAPVGAIVPISTSGTITAPRESEPVAVTPPSVGRFESLSSSTLGAFVVNSNWLGLMECDGVSKKECSAVMQWLQPRAKGEPHPLEVLTKRVIDIKTRLDALEAAPRKGFSRPIVTCVPSMQAATRLSRDVSAAFKNQILDISAYEPINARGFIVAIQANPDSTSDESPKNPHAKHLRAVHVAAALYTKEFDSQTFDPSWLITNAMLPDAVVEFYVRDFVAARARLLWDQSYLFIGKAFVPLVSVMNAYFTHVDTLTRKTNKPQKQKQQEQVTPAVAAAAVEAAVATVSNEATKSSSSSSEKGAGGGGEKKGGVKRERKRKNKVEKRDTANGGAKTVESEEPVPVSNGCVSCESVSDLYRSDAAT